MQSAAHFHSKRARSTRTRGNEKRDDRHASESALRQSDCARGGSPCELTAHGHGTRGEARESAGATRGASTSGIRPTLVRSPVSTDCPHVCGRTKRAQDRAHEPLESDSVTPWPQQRLRLLPASWLPRAGPLGPPPSSSTAGEPGLLRSRCRGSTVTRGEVVDSLRWQWASATPGQALLLLLIRDPRSSGGDRPPPAPVATTTAAARSLQIGARF